MGHQNYKGDSARLLTLFVLYLELVTLRCLGGDNLARSCTFLVLFSLYSPYYIIPKDVAKSTMTGDLVYFLLAKIQAHSSNGRGCPMTFGEAENCVRDVEFSVPHRYLPSFSVLTYLPRRKESGKAREI